MNIIENIFKEKVFKRVGLNLFFKKDALNVIEECEKRGFPILGIDGFFLTEDTTEPSMENSVDFNHSFFNESNFLLAKEFIRNKDDKLFFEITYKEL